MAVSRVRERSNGYYPNHGLRPLEDEAPPLSPLRIRHLKLTGDTLRREGVAGVLVESGGTKHLIPRFFGSEDLDKLEGVRVSGRYCVKFSLLGEDGNSTSVTLAPSLRRIELILQEHLPNQ